MTYRIAHLVGGFGLICIVGLAADPAAGGKNRPEMKEVSGYFDAKITKLEAERLTVVNERGKAVEVHVQPGAIVLEEPTAPARPIAKSAIGKRSRFYVVMNPNGKPSIKVVDPSKADVPDPSIPEIPIFDDPPVTPKPTPKPK